MTKKKKHPIIVSACLAGLATNYKGKAKPHPKVLKLIKEGKAIPVCPEQLGGLPTPRVPAERVENKVFTKNGKDVTKQFQKGADIVKQLVKTTGAKRCILKAKSPSCGVGKSYDGTFTSTLIGRDGLTTEILRPLGVELLTEEDL